MDQAIFKKLKEMEKTLGIIKQILVHEHELPEDDEELLAQIEGDDEEYEEDEEDEEEEEGEEPGDEKINKDSDESFGPSHEGG